MSDENVSPSVEGAAQESGQTAFPEDEVREPLPASGGVPPLVPPGASVPLKTPRRRGISPALIAMIVVIVLVAAGVGGFFGGRAYIQSTETNLVAEAETAVQAEDWATAETAADKALSLQPAAWLQHTHQATTQRGLARYHLGKFDLALEDFAASLAVDPKQMDLYQLRAEYYSDQKQYAQAIADIEVLLESRPEEAGLYKWRGECLRGQGEEAKAIPDLEKALELDSTLVELHTPLMEYYFAQGDLETAAQHAEIVQQNNDQHTLPYAIKAIQHYGKLEYDLSFEAAKAAIERENAPAVAYRLRGAVLTWRYQPEEALADLGKAIEMDSGDVEALALRAFLYIQAQQWDLAKADVESAVAADPEAAATLWAQALWQTYQHDEKQAQELINRAITLQDYRPEFYVVRAQTYPLTTQHTEALADFDKALELLPDFAPAVAGRDQLLFNRNELKDADKEAERIEKLWPNWYGSDSLLVMSYNNDYLYTKATETADKMVKDHPTISDGYILRAHVLNSQHKFKDAIPDLEKALELDPQSLAARYGLAVAYTGQKEYDKALEVVKKLMELDPDSAIPYVLRAQVYIQQAEYTKATQDIQEALKIDPKNVAALMVSARLNMHDNDLIQAINDCNTAMEVAPSDPDPYVMRSQIYIEDEDLKHARQDATKASQLDRNSPMAYALLAQLDLLEEEPSGAIYNARKAVTTAPWMAEANATLGRAYLADDDPEQAVTYLQKAISLDPEMVDVYYYIAQAQWENHNYEQAVSALEKLLDSPKADGDLVASAEKDLAFLKTIPPLKNGLRTVVDDEKGYTIAYDNTWEPQQFEEESDVQVLWLSKYDEDLGWADIDIAILPVESQYSGVSAQLWLKAFADGVYSDWEGYHSVSWGSYRTEQGTAATHTFRFTLTDDDSDDSYEVMRIQYCFVTQGHMVIIQMSSPEVFFEDFLEDMQKIVDTFKFLS